VRLGILPSVGFDCGTFARPSELAYLIYDSIRVMKYMTSLYGFSL